MLVILVIRSLQKAIVNGCLTSGSLGLGLFSSVCQARRFVLPCHCFKHLRYVEDLFHKVFYSM